MQCNKHHCHATYSIHMTIAKDDDDNNYNNNDADDVSLAVFCFFWSRRMDETHTATGYENDNYDDDNDDDNDEDEDGDDDNQCLHCIIIGINE